jgi:diguanylate cyclase (GGDEF)-like protein/PAS domain S-box-containing protein
MRPKMPGRTVQRAPDRELLEWMPDGVLVVNAGGLIVYANARAEKITGYERQELVGQPIELLVPQRLRAIHMEHRREYSARPSPRSMGDAEHDFKVRRKNGSEFSADIALGPVASAGGTSVVAVIRDITERRRFECMLEHQALHDPLTGLANRTLFFDRLNQAMMGSRRDQTHLALVMLDLDGFKLVNDAFGHLVGDAVLKRFAARLAVRLRTTDTAARLGGDEFAWILPHVIGGAAAERMVRELLHTLEGAFSIDGQRIEVNVSAGMALYPGDGDDVEALIRQADRALYSAKRDRRPFKAARPGMQTP